jgi:hypothetical protein
MQPLTRECAAVGGWGSDPPKAGSAMSFRRSIVYLRRSVVATEEVGVHPWDGGMLARAVYQGAPDQTALQPSENGCENGSLCFVDPSYTHQCSLPREQQGGEYIAARRTFWSMRLASVSLKQKRPSCRPLVCARSQMLLAVPLIEMDCVRAHRHPFPGSNGQSAFVSPPTRSEHDSIAASMTVSHAHGVARIHARVI